MSQLGFWQAEPRILADDAGGTIVYHPRFLDPQEAADAFDALRESVPWRAERRMMYEREVDVPRLVASYRIGGELPAALVQMLPGIEQLSGARFNSAGLNLYRDGADSVAPHNDTLSDLTTGEPIALVSLGAMRRMTIRSKSAPRRALDIDLEAGSLLVMSYQTQLTYDHAIPKVAYRVGPRISVAFRVRRI